MTDGSGSSSVHSVTLSGPMTLYESAEARDSLARMPADVRRLEIDLHTTGPWDLAGLQILIATLASAEKAGREVRFIQVPPVCVEIAERSGLGEWLRDVSDSYL